MERVEVAIVGGGISGLAAAHALAKRGVAFVLLEASERLGGVIRTEHEGGFLLEAGPDSLLTQKPEGLALCRELGLEARLVPTNPEARRIFVARGGRLHPLPEGLVLGVPTRFWPFVTSGLFSWRGKLRMGLDLLRPAATGEQDESIASFIGRRLGRECVERLGEPLLAGIHAGDASRLSIRATFPRLVDLERRHGSLIRGLRRSARDGAVAGFVALRGGMQELVEALLARIPAQSIRARMSVTGLGVDAHGLALEVDGERVEARAVILALPAPAAARLLEPVRPGLAEPLRQVAFASTVTLLLGLRREDVAHPLDGYGCLVPRAEKMRTTAVTFASTKLPERAPAGHVLLRVFLGGIHDPGIVELDDAALTSIAKSELGRLVGLRGEPSLARLHRWPQATPQMEVGHLERVARVERELATLPGLFLTGAGLRATGIPDCIADAQRAAEAAAATRRSRLDPWRR